MTRYLEEYDPYMDYYKKVCMDEVFGVTHSCSKDDVLSGDGDGDEVFVDPSSPVKCRKCQRLSGPHGGRGGMARMPRTPTSPQPMGKPPKPSKPLRSSKSFLGGLRKSRSAEALQSLRVNVNCVLPKSPSAADTKAKSRSRLNFLSRFKRMMTSKSEDPLKTQPSCSSLSPSVDSTDSGLSDRERRYSEAVSFRLGVGVGEDGLAGVMAQSPVCEDCEAVRRRFTVIEDQYGSVSEEDRVTGIYKYQSIRRNNPKSKHLSIGRKKFNMDPKKGIEYLIQHGLVQNTPDDIAQFLHKGEGLNKTAIGDYLGERTEFNIQVLKCFVSLHEFGDMILVQALRQFLWSFRLPGEAQKIDRMMECFAERYCSSNVGVFTSTDTCYVLSFAIIMLNTSLHNPAVKDKPNVERFINMNRGINDGGDLPVELLTSIYDNIKKEPFKFPEDDGNDLMHTFFNPDKEGWLWKQGGRYKNWKRRWFILNDNCLYYFEFTTDKEPKGIIPLENIQVREAPDKSKANCFELYNENKEVIKACKTDSEGKVVEGKHHVYRMSAATPDEQEEWMKCIRASISEHPFYDMLAARRKKAQMKAKK